MYIRIPYYNHTISGWGSLKCTHQHTLLVSLCAGRIAHILTEQYTHTYSVQVLQCFASSSLYLGLSALCSHVAASHYHYIFSGLGRPVCRYCIILLALHSSQVGDPACMCSLAGVHSSTLSYQLDQSLGGGAPVCMLWHLPVPARSSSRTVGWEHATVAL